MTICFHHLGRAGRLGNQMWQVASTIGIANTLGDDVSLCPWDYQPFFSIPSHLFHMRPGIDAGTYPLHIDARTRIYLQDFGLWQDIQEVIREYFQPSPLAEKSLYDFPEPSVAVHVRRGDYVTVGPDLF